MDVPYNSALLGVDHITAPLAPTINPTSNFFSRPPRCEQVPQSRWNAAKSPWRCSTRPCFYRSKMVKMKQQNDSNHLPNLPQIPQTSGKIMVSVGKWGCISNLTFLSFCWGDFPRPFFFRSNHAAAEEPEPRLAGIGWSEPLGSKNPQPTNGGEQKGNCLLHWDEKITTPPLPKKTGYSWKRTTKMMFCLCLNSVAKQKITVSFTHNVRRKIIIIKIENMTLPATIRLQLLVQHSTNSPFRLRRLSQMANGARI